MKHLKPLNKKAVRIEETISSTEEDVIALQQKPMHTPMSTTAMNEARLE